MAEKRQHPPKWAIRFLRAICPDHLVEEIEGDLIQRFERDLKAAGQRKAERRLAWSVIRFFRPGIILRNKFSFQLNQTAMFRHYFKTAFRFASNNKGYFAINLVGLAVGMCVCFFALLYVNFELSYDSYNAKADRIYRLVTDVKTSTGTFYQSSSGPMASAMRTSFPEVQGATRIFLDYLIVRSDDVHAEENIAYADSTLFSVFTLPLIHGDPRTVLNAPWNIVLSETAARKYFGSTDPIGKTLLINSSQTAYVTGLMKDMPYNSHWRVDILISMPSLVGEGAQYASWMSPWKRFGFYTYLLLPENYDASLLSSKLPDFVKRLGDQSDAKYTLQLEPLDRVYLHSEPRGSRTGSSLHGSISNVYIFSVVAAFVLFIACFNFINLSTAFSLHRAKEIGVRKVLGSSQRQLIMQFLADAVLLCVFAFFLALFMCILFLPAFNSLAGKIITRNIFEHWNYVTIFFALALAIGILSGLYPAFFISGFHPISSLKGRFVSGSQGRILRKGLVTAQFCIAIILIASTIVVYLQLHHMKNHALGFKKDHMLVIDYQFDHRINNREELLKRELSGISGIGDISRSSSIPGRANHKFPTQIINADNENQELQSDFYSVDYDFLKQFEIGVVEGRPFSMAIAGDLRKSMLINEAAAKALGYHDLKDVIGKRFVQRGDTGLVIGVIKDFHFHSFKEKVRPLTLQVVPGMLTCMTLNISSENLQATIKELESKWQELVPVPFIYFFADEAYNKQYMAEDRFGKLFLCLAGLAILISCLGLVGLSAFSITQRTKEIGVRKILGSSVYGIVQLLTKDFLMLVVIAFLIAAPIAWFASTRWLEDFAYRINIPWWIFILTALAVFLVAFVTLSLQTIKAAMKNPVESLRSE